MTQSPPTGRGTADRARPAPEPGTAKTETTSTGTARAASYRERLGVPLRWWPPALGIAGLLAAEVHLGYPGPRSWLPYVVLLPVTVLTLALLGRTAVRLTGTTLRVGRAELATRFVGRVDAIPAAGKRRVLGPDLDPAAMLVHRPWVGPLLRVAVTDPASSAPYWIFSTRQPERLATLLKAAAGQCGGQEHAR